MMPTILVVDDQQGIRALLLELFRIDGYEAYVASNGHQAIDLLQQHHPDLVLLDMKIPGMDGLEILRTIKQRRPSTCVIMMTAYGELSILQEAIDAGALMHFTKPFDIHQLRQVIREQFAVLDTHGGVS